MMFKHNFKETEIGFIPEDWEVKELSSLGQIITGKTPSTKEKENFGSDYPFITPRDMKGQKFISKTERYLSEKGKNILKNCFLPAKAVCVSCIGSDMGKVVMNEKPSITNQQLNSIVTEEINPEFVYYALLNITNRLKDLAFHSTAVPILNKKHFSMTKIALPCNQTEINNITEILSSLDKKIELNNEMNRTLEAMGHAIFRHWFIHFEFPTNNGQPYKSNGGEMVNSELGEIPKGWEVGKLDDITNLMMGLSPKSDSYNQDRIGVPLLNGAADLKEDKITPTKYTISPTRICKVGDILFCIRATIGNINFADNEYCLGRGVAAISGKKYYHTEFVYFQIYKSLDNLVSQASGSVIKGLSKPDIQNIEIIIPPAHLLRKFSSIISKHFEEIQNLKKENQNLFQIRDSLLPKLMSGKIRVNIPEEATIK